MHPASSFGTRRNDKFVGVLSKPAWVRQSSEPQSSRDLAQATSTPGTYRFSSHQSLREIRNLSRLISGTRQVEVSFPHFSQLLLTLLPPRISLGENHQRINAQCPTNLLGRFVVRSKSPHKTDNNAACEHRSGIPSGTKCQQIKGAWHCPSVHRSASMTA